MKRRQFITLLSGAAAAWPLAARAQQPERMRQVGMLLSGTADDAVFQTWVGAFLQGLAQSGWVIGRNVRIETRWAGSKADDIRRHAQELAALAPDVILAHGSLSTGSTVLPSRAGYEPWASVTSPSPQARRGERLCREIDRVDPS